MLPESITLEGPRLLLRKPVPEDDPFMRVILSDTVTMAHLLGMVPEVCY